MSNRVFIPHARAPHTARNTVSPLAQRDLCPTPRPDPSLRLRPSPYFPRDNGHCEAVVARAAASHHEHPQAVDPSRHLVVGIAAERVLRVAHRRVDAPLVAVVG